jgi:hypothetical protein
MRFRRTALWAGIVAAAGMTACTAPRDSTTRAFDDGQDISLRLQPSSRTMVAGEIITIKANTENLLGRDAEVEWFAPGGEIRTEENGRIARVMFNDPGTYTVSARLFVDGALARRESVTVNVRPLR